MQESGSTVAAVLEEMGKGNRATPFALTNAFVAKRKLAPAAAECWIVAIAKASRIPPPRLKAIVRSATAGA